MSEPKNGKKKRRLLKPRAMDVICLVSGMVIGEVIAMLTQNVGFLQWLSHDVAFGFQNPVVLTFLIFKVAFGVSIHLNPAVVLFALLGLFAGRFLFTSAPKKKQTPPAQSEEDEQ